MSNPFSELFKSGQQERFRQLESFFQSDENLNLKTDLTNDEIQTILMLEFIQEEVKKDWNIDLRIGFVTKLLKELKVSNKRLGRTEAMMVLREMALTEDSRPKSTIRKIIGA